MPPSQRASVLGEIRQSGRCPLWPQLRNVPASPARQLGAGWYGRKGPWPGERVRAVVAAKIRSRNRSSTLSSQHSGTKSQWAG